MTDPTGAGVAPFFARAVRVELETGRTDYIVSCATATSTFTVADVFEVRGRFAVYSERDGDPVYARLMEGTQLRSLSNESAVLNPGTRDFLRGEVVAFTRDLASSNQITLKVESEPSKDRYAEVVGQHLFVEAEDDEGWNAVYEVRDVYVDGGRVVLDVGKATTIRRYRDPSQPAAGFEYSLTTGASAHIPVDVTWRASSSGCSDL